MLSIKLKIDGWKKRYAAIEAQRGMHRRTLTIMRAEKLLAAIERLARRDTNRYVRGWMQAGTGAGLRVGVMPPLQKSKRRDEFLRKLDDQVRLWRGVAERKQAVLRDWYTRKNRRPDAFSRKLTSEINKAERRAARAEDELRKFLTAGTSAVLFFDAGAFVERFNKRKLSTVRDKVYGGTGRVVDSPFGTFILLHNKEPHPTILERRFRTVATAKATAGDGLAVARTSYRKLFSKGITS
ncbi:MAG: hypothetical protein JNL50_13570 [Phycisphaerae bacterium]|nr:hypothetical protein [Phycisphaerae bacterium]